MFDRFNGLPVHILVVHAAVVLAPTAAALGVAYAGVPRWRWLLRWPLVLAALGALATVFVSVRSGETFRTGLGLTGELAQRVAVHAAAGHRLLWVMAGFAVVAVVAAFCLGGPSALSSGRGARTGLPQAVQTVVAVVLVVAAVWVGFQVFRTGEAGSRAVWGASSHF